MLILSSNGISEDEIKKSIRKYLKFPVLNCAIITTASVEHKNNDWHIPRHLEDLKSLGITGTCIDIETENPENLRVFDSIMINGGNPFYLLEKIKAYKADQILKEFIDENKMIIGVSAGSVVLGSTLTLIETFDPDLSAFCKKKDLRGLGFSKVDICPHYSRLKAKFDKFDERLEALEKDQNIEFVRLEDGEAIIEI